MARRKRQRQRSTPQYIGPRKKGVYLRKSRDESNGKVDVLSKHRMQLVELCEKRGWEYTIYEEIGSSDTLDDRPKMMELLADVEAGYYDGVVVMEYERLSRGDKMDEAEIVSTLQRAGTKIITPLQEYDLNDETAEAMIGVAAIFARMDYRKIKRRLQRGKVNGAKQGLWTNGPPPFPYHYHAETKTTPVEEMEVGGKSKRQHYADMKADALAGISPRDIGIKLNRLGVYGNKGKPWTATTVTRLLLHEFHMGFVVYGKTREQPDGTVVDVDTDQWIRTEGKHERLKTPEEHARIKVIITSRRRIDNRAKAALTPLAGLVKCGQCGRTHKSLIHRGRYVLFACQRDLPTGGKCPNSGIHAVDVYEAITIAAAEELAILSGAVDKATSRALTVTQLLEDARKKLSTANDELSRLVDLATSGLLSKEMFAQKQAPKEAAIRRLSEEVAQLEATANMGDMPSEERKERLASLLDPSFWTDPERTDKDRHELLSSIIRRIQLWYNRKEARARMYVDFM